MKPMDGKQKARQEVKEMERTKENEKVRAAPKHKRSATQ